MMPNADDRFLDDYSIDDAAPAQPIPAPPAAETFKQLFDLLGLIRDASAAESRLISLRQRHTRIRSAAKKLAADRAAHAAQVAADRAEIEEGRKMAARVWAHVKAAENAMQAREQACQEREHEIREGSPAPNYRPPDDDGWTAPAGSGMSRTFAPAHTVVRHDAQGNEFPEHTTLTRTAGS